jgi:hypothetical protein
MICHVCGEQAIGQCKTCNRFYCKEHGNITCVVCAESVQDEPTHRQFSDVDVRLPEYGGPPSPAAPQPAYTGTLCAWCREPATGACAKCGQFYCATHRGGTSMFDNTRRGLFDSGRVLCAECLRGVERQGMIGCIIAAVIVVIFGIVAMGIMSR